VLASIAKAHNQTPAAVVINWLWQQVRSFFLFTGFLFSGLEACG
jgi:diketogulonate reductase-like aldo/keto reductase